MALAAPSARFAAAPDNKNHALPWNLQPCSQKAIPNWLGGDIKTNIMHTHSKMKMNEFHVV